MKSSHKKYSLRKKHFLYRILIGFILFQFVLYQSAIPFAFSTFLVVSSPQRAHASSEEISIEPEIQEEKDSTESKENLKPEEEKMHQDSPKEEREESEEAGAPPQKNSPEKKELLLETGNAVSNSVSETSINATGIETSTLSSEEKTNTDQEQIGKISPCSDEKMENSSPDENSIPENNCEQQKEDTPQSESEVVVENSADIKTEILTESVTGNNILTETPSETALLEENIPSTTRPEIATEEILSPEVPAVATFAESVEDPSLPKETDLNCENTQDANCPNGSDPFISISIENTAQVETTIETKALTGENTLEANGVETALTTGDAVSVTNISNTANINAIGSSWEILIQDIIGKENADINLVEALHTLFEKSSGISLPMDIFIQNFASIVNDATTLANSGANLVENAEEGDLKTGNATAITNISNIANVNLIGSSWLFAIINIFGEWTGNLIVPGEGVLTPQESASDIPRDISIENNADIANNPSAIAESGNNTTLSDEGDISITTGNALAVSDTTSLVNTTTIDNNWFLLLINTVGGWTGQVLNYDGGVFSTVMNYAFGKDLPEESLSELSNKPATSITIQNNASIENTAFTEANSGKNILETEGDGTLTTGNASAWNTLTNFINNNIIGNNWFFGVVNVFGSWTGDVEYAYPDLSVSISDNKDTVQVGETLTYVINYKNHGKANSEKTKLSVSLPDEVSLTSCPDILHISGNSLNAELNSLTPGSEQTLVLEAVVHENISNTPKTLSSIATISTNNAERMLEDNTAQDTTQAFTLEDYQGDSNNTYAQEENTTGDIEESLHLSRKSSILGVVYEGDLIQHQLTIKNNGERTLYNIQLKDSLISESGETIGTYIWDIGRMDEDEEVLVSYEVIGNNNLKNNERYEFMGRAIGEDTDGKEIRSNREREYMTFALRSLFGEVASAEISPEVDAIGPDEGTVHGETATEMTGMCVRNLPNWTLWASLLSYGLFVNWALFPTKKQDPDS